MAGTAPLSAQIIGLSVLDSASAYVAPGARLAVPLHVDLSAAGTTTLAALQGALSWSASRLTFDSLRVVSTTGFSLTANTASAASGSVSFNAFGTTALAASGPLAMAYFTAGSGTGGTLLTLAPTIAGNEAGTDVLSLLRVRNLGVCVAPTGAWGDANDDGAVNVIDAQQIARYSVGLSVANSTAITTRGDVTADGAVNVIDAQQIARYSVALTAAARVNIALYTPPAVASVSLTPNGPQTLLVGATVALAAEPRDAANTSLAGCRPVTWTSSNPAVATVSGVGLVTAVGAGGATITATNATSAAVSSVAITVIAPRFLGESFGGGRIFYLLKAGDPGYETSVPHGLIAADEDQTKNATSGYYPGSTGCMWQPGTWVPNTTLFDITQATGTGIGAGRTNTALIMATEVATGRLFPAADFATAYRGGGFADWFLPSRDELRLLSLNRSVIPGFASPTDAYWSSTELNDAYAASIIIGDGSQWSAYKGPSGTPVKVRAIRSF